MVCGEDGVCGEDAYGVWRVWRMEIVCGKDKYGVSSVEDGDSLWEG